MCIYMCNYIYIYIYIYIYDILSCHLLNDNNVIQGIVIYCIMRISHTIITCIYICICICSYAHAYAYAYIYIYIYIHTRIYSRPTCAFGLVDDAGLRLPQRFALGCAHEEAALGKNRSQTHLAPNRPAVIQAAAARNGASLRRLFVKLTHSFRACINNQQHPPVYFRGG